VTVSRWFKNETWRDRVARPASPDLVTRRELYFFDFYRIFEAVALVGVCFSALASDVVELVSPLVAQSAAIGYVIGAVTLFAIGRRVVGEPRMHVMVGLTLDLLAAATVLAATDGLDGGIATLLLVNVSCGALLLPTRLAFLFASLATLCVLSAFGLSGTHAASARVWTEAGLFGVSYLAATALCQVLRRQVAETQQLVEQHEIDLANLSQLNELIIRRMRTGVIVVDPTNVIHRMNESAWHLVGSPPPNRRDLADVAPELSRRLYHWRTHGKSELTPVMLAEGLLEVIPRFTKLGGGDEDMVIVFLDDISLLSRQAEQLTLSSLGRLSASIAHEVRNPLAAISYSAQLLAESEELPEADKRLVDIIRAQCARMNAIVENILQLSRRERSRPEHVDLSVWTNLFVEEYRSTNRSEGDELRAVVPARGLYVLVDPSQLQQVVWNLVQNALRYGRLPDEPARVAVIARRNGDSGPVVLEVVDRGPGIPKRVADQIFEPFFTTNEYGTGLGLYLARQMCEVNQAMLEYVPVAGGGSCFRVTFAPVLAPPTARATAQFS
jgi:two-component system sensor histidine kinase PilS (NtrC family)